MSVPGPILVRRGERALDVDSGGCTSPESGTSVFAKFYQQTKTNTRVPKAYSENHPKKIKKLPSTFNDDFMCPNDTKNVSRYDIIAGFRL